MKKSAVIFFINLGLVLIQTSFLPVLFDYKYYVDLYMAFTMALFVEEKVPESFISALIGGFISDLLTTKIIGISTLLATFILVLFTYVKRFLYRNWIVKTLFSFIAFYIYMFVSNIYMSVKISNFVISCSITLGFFFVFRVLISRIFDEKRLS